MSHTIAHLTARPQQAHLRYLAAWLLACSLLLNGCTNLRSGKDPVISQDWPQHLAHVQAAAQWQATGKLGVKVPNDGGSANLHWSHHADEFTIDLNGPFGQGKLSIEGKPGNVTLTEAGTPPQHAKTAEELITKTTGWKIPVTQLAFWVRGLPAPDLKVNHFEPNTEGLLSELQQAGWTIHYSEYTNIQTITHNVPMPGRIVAEYNDIRLTLVIREWVLQTEAESPSGLPK